MSFNSIVLVKQVPDTESLVQIADDGVSIKKQDIKWIMNPYDEIAVEQALHDAGVFHYWQIADLDAAPQIGLKHLSEAIGLRRLHTDRR